MDILGISCFYHDAAAALIRDGMLIAAAEEERFSRKKHDYGFPALAIDFCLKRGNINGGDLDYVIFYEKPLVKFERILMTCLGAYPKAWRVFRESMIAWFNQKLWIRGQIVRYLGIPQNRVLFAEHHTAHAASALYCSPFEEAAILTVDGVGEWTTATIGRGCADWTDGKDTAINVAGEIRFPHSLGLLYSAFTAFLGFEVNEGEYKVMGMAPYGEPRYLDQVYKLVQVDEDGSFRLNMDYFSFYHSTEHTFNQKFADLFGKPRIPESDFYTFRTHPRQDHPCWDSHAAEQNQKYADIAASIQRVTEEILLKMARHAHKLTGLKKLCLAGGVALNSVANGRLLRETPFEDVFIQPAAGD
jgi:carbamoyltransferase